MALSAAAVAAQEEANNYDEEMVNRFLHDSSLVATESLTCVLCASDSGDVPILRCISGHTAHVQCLQSRLMAAIHEGDVPMPCSIKGCKSTFGFKQLFDAGAFATQPGMRSPKKKASKVATGSLREAEALWLRGTIRRQERAAEAVVEEAARAQRVKELAAFVAQDNDARRRQQEAARQAAKANKRAAAKKEDEGLFGWGIFGL